MEKPCDKCPVYPICQSKTIWRINHDCVVFEQYVEDCAEEEYPGPDIDWLIQDWNQSLSSF